MVLLLAAEIQQPAVHPKLNVLNDESAVHANELHSKSVTRKLRPSVNGISEDTVNFLPGTFV